jgi:predicted transcriptional regulator
MSETKAVRVAHVNTQANTHCVCVGRWRHGLSLSNAAEALGLSRRQVADYASGERPVPRTVLLACKG